MEVNTVNDALDRIFNEDQERIVFWNDPEKEFINHLEFILLEDVTFLRLDEVGALEAKVQIERTDPDGRYLLYSPAEEPDYGDDWLLDIRLYSRDFRADRWSIICAELGLHNRHLREHLKLRRKFFDAKERIRKLKQLVAPEDNGHDLDRKMLAVVTKADQPELFNIVRTLFHSMAEGGEVDLEVIAPAWEEIEKFELEDPFWEMVKSTFGYSEETPGLRNLLIRLLLSDHAQQLGKELPVSMQHLQLPRSGAANAVVCLAQWRDSSSKGSSYNILAGEVGAMLHIEDEVGSFEPEDLVDCTTFLEVDKVIVKNLLSRVSSQAGPIDAERIRNIATHRQAAHWVASSSVLETQRQGRYAVYEALAVAAEFFAMRQRFKDGFDYPDAGALYQDYEAELFGFDQLYRHFCLNADVAKSRGWDVLIPLRENLEACYCNWYLLQLGLAWGKFAGADLLQTWQLPEVPNQYEFFGRWVQPHLDEAENRRAFVIISDALRYEAAQELTQELNGIYRFEAEISSQLGVLPSYTALGMASLLPHEKLEYNPTGDVLVNAQSTSSLAARDAILQEVEGAAIRAEDLMAMKKEEGREFIADKRVLYIYHNQIDAQGDHAATESGTFEAVAKAIRELKDLVSFIVNNLNGYFVLVTADHGFLFSESTPGATDKSKLSEKPSGTVIAKKRYLLGHDLPDSDEVWHGSTIVTARTGGRMEFWIPKGANRFHFMGGARFIHGGAMPQEIVVPVVRVRHLKDKKGREKTKTKKVNVQVIGGPHKITTPKHRFRLLQTEPVSDRTKPITLKVSIYEADDPVTSIETLTFDSTSSSFEEREKSVILTLEDRKFDKTTNYRLVLRDADTGIDQQSVDVTIDRAISDDFDF